MIVKHVYNNVDNKLEIPKEMLPENGIPFSHHFQGTQQENLVELACRNCYESGKQIKTRKSADLHQHINEVGHGSTQQHLNITLSFKKADINFITNFYRCFIDRPGITICDDFYDPVNEMMKSQHIRVTANARSIVEWFKYPGNYYSHMIGHAFQFHLNKLAPNICKLQSLHGMFADSELVTPVHDNEVWLSYYIKASRIFSHELVRHHFNTAISQRSGRYCDESNTEWSWSPFIEEYWNEIDHLFPDSTMRESAETPSDIQYDASNVYIKLVDFLEKKLIDKGMDKFHARKQSRSAARGVLGNALATELIFSASIAAWRNIILQRCSNFADAEIRLVISQVFDDLCQRQFLKRELFNVAPATDGFGYHITKATS